VSYGTKFDTKKTRVPGYWSMKTAWS